MGSTPFSILILAAGKATRFKSERPKVLHALAGLPLGEYVLAAAQASGPERIYMVVGHGAEEVRKAFARPPLAFVEQREQRGTGHAVLAAREELAKCPSESLVVVVGDAPLLRPATLRALVAAHAKARAAATVLTTLVENSTGYGRVVGSGGRVRAIVEEKVATPAQKKIKEINSGILCFARTKLLGHLAEVSDRNAQGEYLLTDLVEILNRRREKVAAFRVEDPREVLGVNDRVELAQMEKVLRRRKADELMHDGVTIVDPETTYVDAQVEVGCDTIIEPGVSLLGRTRVGRACVLRPYSTIADAILGDRVTVRPCCFINNSQIGSDVILGPFAHIRDGAVIETNARIGNFVEVKKSRVGRGSKAWHLTYLGDAALGENVNVGAGTVTCNYDGEKKHSTVIENGAFIGSGTMLVAPIRVGKSSVIAAGSAITEDVPPESLALGRARQVNKEGWARSRDLPKGTTTLTTREDGQVTVIDVRGRLTMGDAANQLSQRARELSENGKRLVVLSFAGIDYIDSSGMGAIMAAGSTFRAAGGQLKLSGIPERVRRLFEVANLDKAFEIHPHEAAAIASFKDDEKRESPA